MAQDNPFLKMGGGVATQSAPPPNPFMQMALPTAPPEDDTALKRMQRDRENLEATITKLKSTVPANEGHKARLDKLVGSLETQLSGGGYRSQGAVENFVRGTASGVASGLQFPVELAGDAASLMGMKDLQGKIQENQALIEEELHPRGKAGVAGEVAGNIVGSLPAGGATAELVGAGIRAVAPSSRLATAIGSGIAGSRKMAALTNVATGLPVQALMAAGGQDAPIPEGATEEEAARIRSQNTAAKIKQFAIGVGVDALFGGALHSKSADAKRLMGLAASDSPADQAIAAKVATDLTPEREAQLAGEKAKNAVKVAVKRRERIDKAMAQSEWQIMNPDLEWKELKAEVKKKVYGDFKDRRSNSNPNTSTEGTTTEQATQLVKLDESLNTIERSVGRDEASRVEMMDEDLDIGNDKALSRARVKADKDPNLVYVFFGLNGLKNVHEAGGVEAGNQLLKDSRDAIIAAHVATGAKPRLFRYGWSEQVAIMPKDQAQAVLSHVEANSVKHYGDAIGSVSGAIHETLDDALSVEGRATLAARKLEAKARQGISGRDAQEQSLVDAVRTRQNTEPAPVLPVADPVEFVDPFPPEAMVVIDEVTRGGGLQSDEARQALAAELVNIYGKADLSPENLGKELQALIEDFTPLEADIPELAPGTLTAAIKMADGTIHTGGNHGAARWDAGIRDNPSGIIDGFVTKEGKFLNRSQAHKFAQENGMPTAKGTTELLTEDMHAPPDAESSAVGETHLVAIEVKKPLEQLTDKQLDAVDDKLVDAMDDVDKKSPEYQVLQRDLDAVGKERLRRNPAPSKETGRPVEPLPEGVRMSSDYSSTDVQRVVGGMKGKEASTVIDLELVRLRKTSPRKMSDGELEIHLRDLENERRNLTEHEHQVQAQKKIDKVLEERAFRAKAAKGAVAAVPPSASQALAGFAFGISQPLSPDAQSDQERSDRITNGLMWAGVAVVGIGLAARMKARSTTAGKEHAPVASDRWAGSAIADAKIVNRSEVEAKPKPWLQKSREWYTGIVRRTYGIDLATEALGGSKLAASKNPAKLISMFGRWVSQAEGALMDHPSYVDLTGNVVPLDAPSYREIAALVNEDIKGLGKLMTARASVEGEGLRKVPFDPVTADLIIRSAPENYHKAADLMRKFDLAMSTVLERAGVLTPGSVERFSTEEFYAALHKVFDPEGGQVKLVRDAKSKKVIISPNPIKGRKQGHTGQVYNPAETTAAMVPQIYRAAEMATIKNSLIDLWEAAGKPKGLIEQVERRKLPISVEQQLRIDALKQEVKGLTTADAEQLVASMDPKSLDPRSNILTVHREGIIRSYKVDETIATAMASLHPDELEGIWKVLGLPAGLARKGVVYNPYFVAKQSFIDNWQATLNSQYGFRFGVDQFIGWTEIIRHTPEYQKFLGAGGGHSTLQSHEFANVKTALARVKGAAPSGTEGPLGVAVRQLRELNIVEAYKTLIIPFSEAARVGEYLRARGHGASVLDGVYAAKHVTANFQQRGGFQVMRGLDRASMFLNPAIQGLDQATFRAGINPFRAPEEGRKAAAAKYLSKAFISVTLPSMYFWMANKDDQEITDLRKTTSGAKFWFIRSPVDQPKLGLAKGDIVKIPKPIVDGQIFGTSMEATMDKMNQDDPASVHRAVEALGRDIAFNILPTAGVLYYGLQTGKNLGTGGNIIPPRDANLAPEHQGEERASWLARTVSKAVAPMTPDVGILKTASTPAGLDYVLGTVGGMLGQDGINAVTLAVEAETKGYVPAKEELPIVSKIFARYPTANVEPIRTFYERAGRVQEVQATMKHLLGEDPERVLPYMVSNQADMTLVGVYDKTRQQLANFQRAIQDLKDAPAGTYTSEDRRLYEKQYLTMMIQMARQTNQFAKQVDGFTLPGQSATPQASRP